MFSSKLKHEIAEKVQEILKETKHPELPTGEIDFLLHVDGAEEWSWANISNNNRIKEALVPSSLIKNTTIL